MKGKTQWEKLPYPYDTKRCKYPYYSLTNQLKPELPKGKSLLNIPENPYEPWHYIPPHLSLDDPASSTFYHTPPLGRDTNRVMTTPAGPCSIPREDFDGGLAFQPWEVDRTHAPDCWDAQRIAALPTGERRDRAWLARRKHAPCCTKIPREWGLDCIYLRLPEEESYARRLSALLRQPTTGPSGDVALNLVSFARPFLPPRWPLLARPTWDPIREFPTTGHLRAPGDDVSRDSAYALFRASGVAGLGDPGRFIREYRQEKRDRRRKVLVSWSQVEFFELAAATRGSLYPALPDWWADVEVSTAMAVPLPPVLTYRGSGLIRGDPFIEQFSVVSGPSWSLAAGARTSTFVGSCGI